MPTTKETFDWIEKRVRWIKGQGLLLVLLCSGGLALLLGKKIALMFFCGTAGMLLGGLFAFLAIVNWIGDGED
jgi:hypothetical protein